MTETTNKKKNFFYLNYSYYRPLDSAARGARTTRLTLVRPLVTPGEDLQDAINPLQQPAAGHY